MATGKASPIADKKLLGIAAAVIIILIVGAIAVINGGKNGTEATKLSKEEAEKAREKGLDLYKKGDWSGAVSELTKAAEGNPKDLYTQTQLAQAYEQNGQIDEAFKQYEAVLKIDKNSADAHYNMGRILVQKKELDKAIAEFETAAKLNPNFTGARASLARAYVEKKAFDKALATYNELEALTKSDSYYVSRIYSDKGNVFKLMGQRANAKASYEKALELDAKNAAAKNGLDSL